MYQEAINTLLGLMNQFPGVYKLSIIDHNHIEVNWTDEEFHTKEFNSVPEMIEWLENNIEKKAA